MLQGTTDQYLYLEGKKTSTASEWYVIGTGILISHIHQGVINANKSTNSVNAGSGNVHGVNIVEASTAADKGLLWTSAVYEGTLNDLFCSETRATFDTTTTPSTEYYTNISDVTQKSGNSKVAITGIGSRGALPIAATLTISP